MPWDYFVGCEASENPPVWPLACYHSRLSGDCAEEEYDQLQKTSDFMGFGCFKEVFDTYLALDITAYADLMQIFRQHFFYTHHLDPFLFPSLPSAAWDAALRSVAQQGSRPFRLITSLDVYKDVKKAMMGGLCAVFRPHSEANFEGVEGYNEHAPAKRILYLDVNSIYPHAMTKYLPCSSGEAVTLPEGEDEKLKWLHDMLDSFDPLEDCWQTVYLGFVNYDFPEALHDGIDFFRLLAEWLFLLKRLGPTQRMLSAAAGRPRSWFLTLASTSAKASTSSDWLSCATTWELASGRFTELTALTLGLS